MSYEWILIYLHAVAGVLFLGNILVTFIWKRYADRTSSLSLRRFGADLVIRTDWIFTVPAAGLLVGSGLLLAHLRGHDILGTAWLLGALVLFGLSGLVWLAFLVPNQKRQKILLSKTDDLAAVEAEHARLRSKWLFWGVVSTIFAFGAFLMMFVKHI